jgi:hypothetical protein
LTGLILGPIFVAISWIGTTDRYVNRVVDLFESGRATDLDRDVHARRLRVLAIVWYGDWRVAFGYSLANLLFR